MALSVRVEGAGLRVVVVDDGPAFDPLSIAAPDTGAGIDDRDPGGLGLHLVRRLASGLSYARADGCNRMSLVLAGPD
jgi:serine/threonine-protein kinase RsbW